MPDWDCLCCRLLLKFAAIRDDRGPGAQSALAGWPPTSTQHGRGVVEIGREIGKLALFAAIAAEWGCAHGPRSFQKVDSPAPLVRARAVGLGRSRDDAKVIPALVNRLDDSDPVVRLAAYEELRHAHGAGFWLCPMGEPRGTRRTRRPVACLDRPGSGDHRCNPSNGHAANARQTVADGVDLGPPQLTQDREGFSAMHAPANVLPSRTILGPVAWLGHSVTAAVGYVGGVTLLAAGSVGAVLWPAQRRRRGVRVASFFSTLMQQLRWMLVAGFPIVGMVHIALGSFLSLQAYYGSTFVDGTGAVVGVGLLRNLGGIMTGLTFAGIMAGRMIPELRLLARRLAAEAHSEPRADDPHRHQADAPPSPAALPIAPSRLAAPRVAAAGIACLLLSQWGIAAGTFVGWQASQSMMGLPTETFFMMLMKMMWFRDVVGLIVKGVFFGVVPAAICCYEGVGQAALDAELSGGLPDPRTQADEDAAPPWSTPIFRAYCLSCAAILFMNSSWFILVYHAVPFYGPTLLAPPSP